MPAIIMDSSTKSALVKGISISDDWSSYQQILTEIKQNLQRRIYNDFNFQLKVFNTKSAKLLLEIFREIKKSKHPISIHWLYDQKDAEMREMGMDYSELLGMDFIVSPN